MTPYTAFPGPRKGWCGGVQAGILNSRGGAARRLRAGLGSPIGTLLGHEGRARVPLVAAFEGNAGWCAGPGSPRSWSTMANVLRSVPTARGWGP